MRNILIMCLIISLSSAITSIDIVKYPVLSEKKLELMTIFAERHYGLSSYHLYNPTMVIIHYTALPSLRFALNNFKTDSVDSAVEKLAPYGAANLGTHYIIDFDGTIYELVPSTVMVRHVIGYDHVSISIQNVGSDASYLTEEQLESNAELINFLHYKHPSLNFLVGHMEYMNTTLPHFDSYLKLDEELHTPVKIDPGWNFLKDLRYILKERYDLEFKK
jgi:N-acetylmuramoyl-L-alanine amidase